MEKNNIPKLIEEIKNNSLMERVDISALCDYGETRYLCDVISEIADNYIDIYYYDLFEWAKTNFCKIEEANEELGASNDITQQIQQAQYLANEQEIYNNIEDMILLYIYNLLLQNGIEELTPEELGKVEELAEDFNNNDYLLSFENIMEEIKGGEDNE